MLLAGCVTLGILLAAVLLLIRAPGPDKPDEEPEEGPSILSVFTPKPRIPDGAAVSGIPVGGMTEQEAVTYLNSRVPDQVEKQDMLLTAEGKTLTLSPEKTLVHWDIESAVKKALSGESANVSLELAVDQKAILEALRQFFGSLGGVYSASGCWLEGDAPNLETLTDPCQTLVLTKGSAGLPVDIQEIYDILLDAYEKEEFLVELGELGERKEPNPLDLEKIFQQVSVPPVNPDLDRQTLELIPGKKGYGFDLEEAASLLEQTADSELTRVPMKYLDPELSEQDVWYQDTLGYCKTEHTDNENRNENLRLACAKLDGIILQPGDVLSYNETLGQRTQAAGYKPAPAYSGTELVDEIGGGICQVSSTLYLSSLFAELKIVERKNHGFPANYIPLGLDATVNWGTTDLKIRNDYDLPVKIRAEVSDGYVKVRIMGVERRDYQVKMEYRVDDHPSYAAAYRCRYDLETGELISRELDHTSIYLEDVWCWPGFAQSDVDEAEEAD